MEARVEGGGVLGGQEGIVLVGEDSVAGEAERPRKSLPQ